MHLGFALLTLLPGRVGGSESYVRGLLGQFAAGNGPERVTVLANHEVMKVYGKYARGPVRLHHLAAYRPGGGSLTRALAMIEALAVPPRVRQGVPPVWMSCTSRSPCRSRAFACRVW